MLFYCCVPRGNYNEWPLLEHKMSPKKHHWQARGLGESVGADSSIKLWVMVHFIYVGFPRGAIVTRHLQPGENASTVRGHATSNGGRLGVSGEGGVGGRIWVEDFNRRRHYPGPQAWIRGAAQSICRVTGVSPATPLSAGVGVYCRE